LTDQVTIQETEELTCEHLEEVAAGLGAGLGAGKVSMQDFHFAASSATGGAGAGKVSMQDFHFV
jgi:hypothetical protein